MAKEFAVSKLERGFVMREEDLDRYHSAIERARYAELSVLGSPDGTLSKDFLEKALAALENGNEVFKKTSPPSRPGFQPTFGSAIRKTRQLLGLSQ